MCRANQPDSILNGLDRELAPDTTRSSVLGEGETVRAADDGERDAPREGVAEGETGEGDGERDAVREGVAEGDTAEGVEERDAPSEGVADGVLLAEAVGVGVGVGVLLGIAVADVVGVLLAVAVGDLLAVAVTVAAAGDGDGDADVAVVPTRHTCPPLTLNFDGDGTKLANRLSLAESGDVQSSSSRPPVSPEFGLRHQKN
jgi:hypothetical protein